jgi:hypothetical protein
VLLTAAVADPGKQFVRSETKWYVAVKMKRRRLLLEVTGERVIHVGDAGTHRIESLEGAHESAGRKHLDFDAAAGAVGDRLRHPARAGKQARYVFGPVSHHLQLSDSLCDRRRREAQGRGGGQ